MSRIEIISASAGSGKTYRLATVLEDAVASRAVRPDRIVATTFTNKAAAELKERARTRLLAAGRVEDAERLAAARIGTVNAVCGRLVSDFSFELGLAPDLRVLDEPAAGVALRQALSRAVSDDDARVLAAIAWRFPKAWDWQDAVQRVVLLARANAVAPARLAECARRSRDEFLALFGVPEPDGAALDRTLEQALARFLEHYDPEYDTTKGTAGYADEVREAQGHLRRGHPLRWSDWFKLATHAPTRKSLALAAPIQAAAAAHDRHPRLRDDLTQVITRLFAIAARALEAYDVHKRAWGAIDFIDQEVYALQLLARDDVRARLAHELDLVLVDEFQDTSPLQLAIFLRLADLARRSVWVGDQKQAIYGFRGTDPALMDAAVAAILEGAEPETLDRSWRSRPELVRLTSDVFARGFAAHGVPESRVRLTPEPPTEPPGLGPVVERWRVAARNRDQDAHALAAAVREFVTDPEVRVRDRRSGAARPVHPGDVAVLCATNATCAALADALAAQGIRAVVPRAGLVATPEARLVLAGLRLFVDPRDTLAAAELARLAVFPADGDAWLAQLVRRPGREAFAGVPPVRRVLATRDANPHAGALAALDLVLEAVEARERCLEWGPGAARLANLDALRAHAVVYAGICATEGAGCTPAGLVAAFGALHADGLDARAAVVEEDAVTVSTWHRAKGLEWPVVVLFDLDHDPRATALGVQVATDRRGFDLADPLAERWIRFWPGPYHPAQLKAPFHDRLAEAPATIAAQESEARQAVRLLYVGWTRARDRVVLAGRPTCLQFGMISGLRDAAGPLVIEPADDGTTTWAGRAVQMRVRATVPGAPVRQPPLPGDGYVAPGPRVHPPAALVPSAMAVAGAVGAPERVGDRIPLSGDPDFAVLGQAIHGFLAADRPGLDAGLRREMAAGLLARWGVAHAVSADDLLAAGDRLRAWVDRHWPGAVWRREWPLLHRQPSGTVVRGTADLVLEHAGAVVIVDHKSYPGSVAQALERVPTYAGQVAAYAAAVTAATGMTVAGSFVHLPISGVVVPLVG